MMRILAGTARISTKIIKDGSVKGRNEFCQKLENKFYNRIKYYKHRSFSCIEENIKEILPTKLVQVEKLPDDFERYNGAVLLANEANKPLPAEVVGYIVALKPNSKKEHICGVSVEVLMHEIHHLFHHMTHPKIPNRIYKVSKLSKDFNFEQFFVEHFQSSMLPWKCKEETEKLLEKEKEHKIDLLQYFRYKLIDEIGAYETGETYANLNRSMKKKNPTTTLESRIQTMYLHSKLADITIMLQNALNVERKKIQ